MFLIYQQKYHNKYNTPEILYQGLKKGEDAAWTALVQKITPSMDRLGRKNRLSPDDIEELISTVVLKHVECLQDGRYQFDGGCPSRFSIGIAENRVKDYWRTKPIDNLEIGQNLMTRDLYKDLETKDLVDKSFEQFTEAEKALLRQKYQNGYTDAELIAKPNAAYATEMAIRQARRRVKERFKIVIGSLWLNSRHNGIMFKK